MARFDTLEEALDALAAQPYSLIFPSASGVLVCENHKQVEKWLIDTWRPKLNCKVFSRRPYRAPDMRMHKHKLDLLEQLETLEVIPGLLRDIAFIKARLRYPMADILAKVEGDTIAARARKIGVSRQTLYVWANEKLRPSAEQAETLEKLTSVPAPLIRADITKRVNEIEQAARETRAELAKADKGVPPRAARTRPQRKRVARKQELRRAPRTVHRRARGKPREVTNP